MFNPLVDSFENLSDAELEETSRNLSRKYFQTQNPQLQQQISVMIDMYHQEMQARSARQAQKMSENSDTDLDSLINVS